MVTETLVSGIIFTTVMVPCRCIYKVTSCAPIFKFLYGPLDFPFRGKFMLKITIFGDLGAVTHIF